MFKLDIPRSLRDTHGGSAAEFALVFPLLVILMFAVMTIGQAFYAAASTQWAVERSVRALMIDRTVGGEQLEAEVRRLLPGLRDLQVDMQYTTGQSGIVPTGLVQADISYPIAVPFLTTFQLRYRLETVAPRPF